MKDTTTPLTVFILAMAMLVQTIKVKTDIRDLSERVLVLEMAEESK